jgi:hypothetical protein
MINASSRAVVVNGIGKDRPFNRISHEFGHDEPVSMTFGGRD